LSDDALAKHIEENQARQARGELVYKPRKESGGQKSKGKGAKSSSVVDSEEENDDEEVSDK
jgi:hypothetical protein